MFDVETQLIEAPSNEDLNETDVFDMPTQAAVLNPQKSVQPKQFPAVLTQSSQPANTPGLKIINLFFLLTFEM